MPGTRIIPQQVTAHQVRSLSALEKGIFNMAQRLDKPLLSDFVALAATKSGRVYRYTFQASEGVENVASYYSPYELLASLASKNYVSFQ